MFPIHQSYRWLWTNSEAGCSIHREGTSVVLMASVSRPRLTSAGILKRIATRDCDTIWTFHRVSALTRYISATRHVPISRPSAVTMSPGAPVGGLIAVIRVTRAFPNETLEPLGRFCRCEPAHLRLDQPREIFVGKPDQFVVRTCVERDLLVSG